MKRFLFKFFFVLMALIAAIPAQAATIYFKNTVEWSTVYVHFYKSACWDNNQGAGGSERKEHVSVTPMKIIDGTDIYSCECTGDYPVVAFTKEEQGNYYGFNGNKVVYREDFSTSKPLFTPDNSQYTSLNNCTYYKQGTWSEYSEPLQPQLAAPTFSPAGGEITSAQNVTISAANGATIYYTTDKSDPTTSSTVYSEPITVSKTTTIKAIAVKDGLTSEIAEATYTINSTPTPTTYYLKHPWGGGDWTWAELTKDNGDGTYSLEGKYCKGAGCNWSTASDGKDSKWIPSPTVIGNPATGDDCTFTLDPTANNGEGAITITRVGTLTPFATPTIAPEGGTFTSAQTVTITSEEGATIYYTTDGNDPTTDSKVYNGAFKVNTVGTTTVKAIAVKEGFDISAVASKTYTINKPYKGTIWISGGVNVDNGFDADTNNKAMTEKDESGVYTYVFDWDGDGNAWAFRAERNSDNGGWTWLSNNVEVTPTQAGTYTEMDNRDNKAFYYSGMVKGKKYVITLNTIEGTVSIQKLAGGTAGDIPVYPAGVNSEAELNAYDFEANPVYYLLADVLNDNRVTPEWQLTKGADGLYHLNGFAMRNTGAVKVRQYTSAGTYVDYDSKAFTTALNTSEGQLYNATFDPDKKSLTLEAASGTKMPFISLVGYMMQQDKVYVTPRGVEGTPADTKTSKGWQEAWLQYDANGKLLKDRKGNVMYSTMWPPKNPVYFTATISENNQRLYSSDQMTFVPVKDADGNNVGKTGAEWKADLKALDAEAYTNLNLDDDKTYNRYVVSDIWYVGAGKIWTGWGGETTYDNNKQIAQWSKHKNWGYEDKNANDTDGTPINAQTTYKVVTDKGNFLFNNPTYFKTFEFFYETVNPNENSQIYTTLAYGSASIAAKNVKDGESYKKGSYQATVSVPEGVTISSWTITRHDATTDALAPIGSDNGKVATYSTEKTDPTSDDFTPDEEGLGEGRYYYELTVTFSNGRTSTVRSNPFVIYFPNQYSVDANGYQLVKLDEKTADDYSYVTYNAKANGDLYFVEFTDNTVSKFRVATSAERESLNGKFAKNEGIKWTDKVFVYAPVPSEFKIDAEKASATVSLDKITSYNVNSTTGIAPVQKELAVVDLKQNFANKVYKAVMNYQQKDPAATVETWNNKTSLGKENLTVMRMPNVKGGTPTVSVTCTENSEVLSIDYKGTAKTHAANYYNVNVELPFSDPNVEAAVAPQYEVKVTDANDVTTTKVYTASVTGERAIKFTNVNPLDFEGKSIEVNAKYFDGEGYNLYANLGESANLASGTVKFTSGCTPEIHTLNAIASKAPVIADGNIVKVQDKDGNWIDKQKDVIVVTKLGVSHDGTNDNIGGESVAASNALYNADYYLEGATEAAHNGVYTWNELNFAATEEFENGHHVWKNGAIIFDNNSGVTENPELKVEITPFYVAKVTNTEGTVGLTVLGGSATQGDETYVALTCKTAVKDRLELVTSVTDITESANVKAYKVIENGEIRIIYGDRKFNVMGAEVK